MTGKSREAARFGRGGGVLGGVLLLLWGMGSSSAQDGPSGLLGDPWGVRSFLEERGIQFDPVWTSEIFWNLRGGMDTHHARVERQDASLYGRVDTARAGLWKGGLFFFHLQKERGRTLTPRFTGDFQALSNMEAPDFQHLSEVWFRQTFLGGRLAWKAGKQDASRDFSHSVYAQEFLNSSAATLPHVPFPTFPDPDLGLGVFLGPFRDFSFRLGCFQSRPKGGRSPAAAFRELHGPLLLAEPALHYGPKDGGGSLHGGVWWRNDKTPPVGRAGRRREAYDHAYGGYLFWDHRVLQGGGEGETGPLGSFFQVSWAPGRLSEVACYLGGGFQWTGVLPGREADVVGLGCFQVRFSGKTGFERHSETALELFYRWQASPWAAFKPDLQYILSPGGRSRPGALAAGLRVEVRF